MANRAQTAKIWASARELGFEEAELRDVVEQVTPGSRSISALSFRQAGAVIEALVRLGASPGRQKKPSGRRTSSNEVLLRTGDQRALIEDLRGKLGDRWLEDRYFEGACMKLLKKPRPSTAGHGARVIEMLKARLRYEESRGSR